MTENNHLLNKLKDYYQFLYEKRVDANRYSNKTELWCAYNLAIAELRERFPEILEKKVEGGK